MFKQVGELEVGDVLVLRSGNVVIKRHITKVTEGEHNNVRIVHKLTPDSEAAGINTLNGDAFIETTSDGAIAAE